MQSISLIPESNPDALRAEVRDFYAERVRGQSSCCSGSGKGHGQAAYDTIELSVVPDESAAISFGCGNPGAIAALQPGEVVLDMGSGGGIDCFLAADKVGPAGYVYGVDMTDEMLAVARRSAERQGRTNVEFRKGVIEALPVEANQVDVIISNCVLNLSPDKPAAFAEAFRVLRPGGRLAVSDVVIDGTLVDLPVNEAQVRQALHWAGCVAGAMTIDELTAGLAVAGFAQIEIVPRFHYDLESLGPVDMGPEGLAGMSVADAEQLAARFASADIRAVKPAIG
jgi:SAM-dependent methyltransferase